MSEPSIIETSPVDGRELGTYAEATAGEVQDAVARGRRAFQAWRKRPVNERLRSLRQLRSAIVERLDEVVERVVATTGKPDLDALTGDVYTVLDFIAYHEQHAAEVLARESRPGHLLSPRSEFAVQYEPLGVIGVLSPWNYPLQLAMLPMVTALAAGSVVVLKPSEVTPSIGVLIAELCADAALPEHVVQVVQGGPAVGQALVAARPDKVFFTGSVSTGKKIMAAAAAHLTPIELELGGKDPMLVFADAPFERAVNAATYGAFVNAGQACISVERVYVERPLYERFVAATTEAALALRVGTGRNVELGPIIRAEQCSVIERHLDDALAKGARLTTPRARQGRQFGPLVLRDVNHEMLVMTEETFGPVLPIMPFESEADGIRLANDSIYGLNASVWTKDRERGRRVASELVTGSCAINDVLKNVANPRLPFGGERQSGLGRYHGPEGLRAFSRTKAVMHHHGNARAEMNWFPYRPSSYEIVKSSMIALFSDESAISKAGTIADQWLGSALGLLGRKGEKS